MSLLLFFLQVITSVAIFAHKLPRKPHFPLRAVSAVVGTYLLFCTADRLFWSVPAIAAFSSETHIQFSTFIVVILCMLSVWLCFDCTFKTAVLCGSCGYALQNCVYYLKRIIMMAFSLGHDQYDALMAPIVFAAAYVAFFCIDHWLIETDFRGDVQNTLAFVFPLSVLSINVVMSACIPWSDDTMLYCLYAFLLSLSLIVIHLGAFNLASAKVEKKLLEQMIAVEQKQHTVYEDTINMINLKCHDIKHEIGVLLKEENIGIRTEEVKKVQSLVNLYGIFLKTGNPTLDVVLSEKNVVCERNSIPFTCIADGSSLSFMDTVDVCTLLGNALDNAIESAKKEPDREKRFISMSITHRGPFVSIHIENSCCTQLQYRQGELVSDKVDEPGFHGFGAKSMHMVTEKYGGSMAMKKMDEIFYLDILLPAAVEAKGA